jgi:phage-related protein
MAVLPKRLLWRGSAFEDFTQFPASVQREMGYALYLAQMGERHRTMAKTLKGFGGASILEIRESDSSGTYRAVYTVKFSDAVYVLHAFQKKSKQGVETPRADVELIERRLKELVAGKR